MKLRFFFFLSASLCALCALAWSQKGHDVTCYIAEQHLTPATQAAVDSIFEGKSLVYWANWLDNASHNPPLAYTSTWHYKNINEGVPFEKAPVHPAGDVVTAASAQIRALSSGELSPEEAALALKVLVHIMGDMHQPMHLGRQTDLGGNRTRVKFFDRDTNLHSIWDSNVVESGHKWSYTEWQQQIDRASAEEEAAIIAGTVEDWAKQTWQVACEVYEATPKGAELSYNYIADFTPIVEQQLLRGGLRLAHVLNTLFDPAYTPAQ